MNTFPTCVKALAAIACLAAASPARATDDGWVTLFNGKDLSGWTAKFAKQPLGANPFNTFRVEDGILKVSYADYPKFDDQYGHLFTNNPYSHYLFRLEYRFEGNMMADAPGYVNLNSGVMIHAQSPQSMLHD